MKDLRSTPFILFPNIPYASSYHILTLLKVHLLIFLTSLWTLPTSTGGPVLPGSSCTWALQNPMVYPHFPQGKTPKTQGGRPLPSQTRPTEFADWVPSPKGISKLSRSLPAKKGCPTPLFLRAIGDWHWDILGQCYFCAAKVVGRGPLYPKHVG